jgi:hypothetical protein
MTEPVNPAQVIEALSVTNLKTVAEAPSFYASLAMANAVNAQQSLTQLGLTILARATDLVTEKQIEEGGVLTAALQQLMKGAQTTPPVTP